MILTFKRVEHEIEGKRSAYDKRRKPNSVIVVYIGEDGWEYRKRFSSYGKPEVPQSGTHAELNAKQEQW